MAVVVPMEAGVAGRSTEYQRYQCRWRSAWRLRNASATQADGPCLAFFRFAADKAASPVVHDVKRSKSVADARAVEGRSLRSSVRVWQD